MRHGSVLLALGLLSLLSVIVGVAAIVDYRDRTSSPEGVVRRYFAALEGGDTRGALLELAPVAREPWTGFVENGVFNVYRITGIAVRQTSLLDSLRGRSSGPRDVTIFLDITLWANGAPWQAAPRVPLVHADDRWYLAYPPLAPEP